MKLQIVPVAILAIQAICIQGQKPAEHESVEPANGPYGNDAVQPANGPIPSNGPIETQPNPQPKNDEMLQEMQELKKLVKGLNTTLVQKNTEACCTDYTFAPKYDRCADCHYASWYKPRLN